VRAPILDAADPGLYRNGRGISGSHPAMLPQGARVPITTGEVPLPPVTAEPSMRSVFDPHGLAFALMFLLALLFLIHARASVALQAGIGTKR
jgi:hypothetical protein